MNGVVLSRSDLDQALPDADPQLYGLASYFIEAHFPQNNVALRARVRALIEPLLRERRCTQSGIAEQLGMTARVLQRELKAEGSSFEAIRDEVRKSLASRYMLHSKLPLIRIAGMLGYTDTAALTKSCRRWFAASPSQLRRR